MAAVLGHETGHVTAKHSLAGYQRAVGVERFSSPASSSPQAGPRGYRKSRGSPRP